jgi:hypothetical protein
MAITQIARDTPGRAYYRRKRAAGKSHREALRCLKRRLSDVVYRQLLRDAATRAGAGPAGHTGATQASSAAGSHPYTSTSDQSLTGPANRHPYNRRPKRLTQRGAVYSRRCRSDVALTVLVIVGGPCRGARPHAGRQSMMGVLWSRPA